MSKDFAAVNLTETCLAMQVVWYQIDNREYEPTDAWTYLHKEKGLSPLDSTKYLVKLVQEALQSFSLECE